ncbi:MAG TPA: SCO family protein [Longimicrobiales bacterium]|nr:SCO family protein [Longimicrobiales bacterium]
MTSRALKLAALAAILPFVLSCDAPRDAHAAGPYEQPTPAVDGEARLDAHPLHGRNGESGRAAAPQAPSGRSVYVLPGEWRDQSGASLTLAALAGRPRVVAFVYTSCAHACPRIVARMKQIETQAARSGIGLVLVSIDPERDTPERLARYAESMRMDPERWTLLNGPDHRILELSVLLDVPWFATGDGEFGHANVLTLLDRDGVVRARVEGLESELTPILDALAG